ncbi:MAG: PQQ-dependent sugar dehydrogenase [Planctomycetia bacterium]|nr:PQQ-dependent sugar dehydrogenase [Planctomycetia bacterium]
MRYQGVFETWIVIAVATLGAGLANESAAADSSADAKAYEQRALTHAGNAKRGRELFFDEQLTKCVVCHKLDGKGGDAGPDLSAIGGKFDRPHLIESLLEPSRQIVEGFRTTVCSLNSGRVVTGVVREKSEQTITLFDVDGKRQVVPLADIDERQESDVSLMPVSLQKSITPEQFTDLISFLETCRSGIKGTPGSNIAGGITLPDGFSVEVVATGLTGCTALETTADGRILICEQTGTLRVVKDGKLLTKPALSVLVEAFWERGLIGVTVDPDFPRTPFVYVCYVAQQPYPHHRISRFTMQGDVADPASEKLLLEGDDQRKLGGKIPAGHQGGALHFGTDGKLYIGIGEQTAGQPSQNLDTFQGKLLRINADGSIPDDNPFLKDATGKYRAIWARGLRNPFTFAIRQTNGDMAINDIGSNLFEEVNVGVAGGNYGWPISEGPTDDPRFQAPIHTYKAASACGADFVANDSPWPATYRGKYVFAEYIHGWIKTLDVHHPEQVDTFVTGLRNPVDLRFAADRSLYVLLRNAWVMDNKFPAGTGSLLKISRQKASVETSQSTTQLETNTLKRNAPRVCKLEAYTAWKTYPTYKDTAR